MSLGAYHKKRQFDKTPEPKGATKKAGAKSLVFVVQEHHASRLHYDFRLELDGVLKSWAIPKGPSLDPHEHHLAVMTEDHPFEYRTFEGVIPEGNYGAGNVIIWDQGWYEPRETTSDQQKALHASLKKGHITFILHGKKLKGEFALIKLKNADDPKAWLLIKKGDEYATTKDITKQEESVVSHKKVDELGAYNKLPGLAEYPRVAKPWHVTPMLCTLVEEPFSKEGWLFEVKWDGYRAIGAKHGANIQLYSRNANSFLEKYPPAAEALRAFKHDVIVDGEIVVVDSTGAPHFESLQGWQSNPDGDLKYFIFDLLWLDGHDLRKAPLAERKRLLKTIMPKNDILQFSDDLVKDGERLFAEMRRRNLEGMVAKKADSLYRDGERGPDWLKVKTHLRQEVVIGGYTEPRASRTYLGALVVGVYDKGKLIYTGHSGGGIPDRQRKELAEKLAKIERKTSPFAVEPKPNAPVHWVEPKLVCEMSFTEWTSEGSMRHPQFEGMRSDKKPMDVHREKPKSAVTQTAKATSQPEFTHLDKVFFPKHKFTKGDLVAYYADMADYILPYTVGRACSMNRMPDGIGGPSFYQKNNEHLPDWVPRADIFSDSNNADLHWVVGDNLNTILYMVQLGCIEINPWNSRTKKLSHPDWLVIDLDPEGVSFGKVVEVAHTVKQVCDEWKVPTYPKTSGKTGIHVYVPLGAKYTFEQARMFAHLIVIEVNKRQPKLTSIERNPEHRKNRIYLDWLQNREGQTLATAYSVRPTPDASVSMPLRWDEVNQKLKPSDFTIKNAAARVKQHGDLWKPVLGKGIDLAAILKRVS